MSTTRIQHDMRVNSQHERARSVRRIISSNAQIHIGISQHPCHSATLGKGKFIFLL